MLVLFCVLAISILVTPSLQNEGPITDMTITHVWKNLEYWFETAGDYQYAIENGLYIEQGFKRPFDIDIYVDRQRHGYGHEHEQGHGHDYGHGHGDGYRQAYRHRHGNDDVTVFLTTPRVAGGMPYTLAVVSNLQGQYGPKLLPYPNFSAHSPYDTPSCNRIISVFRIYVDPCNRLWVIDSGRDLVATNTQVCPPKILLYDLRTDELIFKYTVPEGQYIPAQSVLSGIIVDIYDPPPKGKCRQAKAYITDQRGFSLLVFDLAGMTSWVIYNNRFKYDPTYSLIPIAGQPLYSLDGLYTSTPFRRDNKIFLHSLTSLNELAAPLNLVNDRSLWISNPSGNQDIFQVIGSRPTQSPTQAVDSHGNIYFSLFNPLEIVSWNASLPYELANFEPVVLNTEDLQFVVGLKVRYNSQNDEVLLALSNRLQKISTGTMSLTEQNFRIMVCKISTLQRGKGKCGSL